MGTMEHMTPREQLEDRLAGLDELLSGLRRQLDEMIAASLGSNADDEHDPEGSTIAFERQQVSAMLDRSRHTRGETVDALTRLDAGTYGGCEDCGQPIGAERLQARPNTRQCIACAAGSTPGR